MGDVLLGIQGQAGRITLNRPDALNAVTSSMLSAIEQALESWRDDEKVAVVVMDAAGEKAFCAGGDIAELYAAGRAGDFAFGRRFWKNEYRLNAKLATYPKPVISLMQGFTMGGGVGLGCHAAHRIVGRTSQIAMPECGIGLVPDVGGSLLLARAPGRLGEYLGVTGARMGPADAIHAGFADRFIAEQDWPDLIRALCETGDPGAIAPRQTPAPGGTLAANQAEISRIFDAATLPALANKLGASQSDIAAQASKALRRNSPLAMAAALILIRRVRQTPTIQTALMQEYRYTWRASQEGDFLEGIRAAIIDKDRKPNWHHSAENVTEAEAARMLASLGENELTCEERP